MFTSSSNPFRVEIRAADIPSWVPRSGAIADISLNTLLDVRGQIDNAIRFTGIWCGVAHAPWWGRYGRLVGGGGGHADGADNFLMSYDIDTRLFSIIKPPAPVFYAADGYVADPVTGWLWADSSGTKVQVGQPFTSHFYGHQVALPPGALAGATNGWLFTPGRIAMPSGGQRGTSQSHKIALGDAITTWTKHGTPLSRDAAHGPALYDSRRNRVVSFGDVQASASREFPYIDIATSVTGNIQVNGDVYGYYAVAAYHVAQDCYMVARYSASGLYLKIIDAATNRVTAPVAVGTPPNDTAEGAWEWIDAWNAWAYYPGSGNQVYTLKCSGDPRTGTWTWARQTVTGTARSRDSGGGAVPLNRLRYCAPLRTLIWFADSAQPVQAMTIDAP